MKTASLGQARRLGASSAIGSEAGWRLVRAWTFAMIAIAVGGCAWPGLGAAPGSTRQLAGQWRGGMAEGETGGGPAGRANATKRGVRGRSGPHTGDTAMARLS